MSHVYIPELWRSFTPPPLDPASPQEAMNLRAFSGFLPAYWGGLEVLAHDGWRPTWSTWLVVDGLSAAWSERASNTATWTERT